MNRSAFLLTAIFIINFVVEHETAVADDMLDLQGKWQMTSIRNGVEQRVVKTVAGATETVEVYIDDKLVQKHHVDFELKVFGPAKVFTWKNGRIGAGPNAGKKLPDGRFIYRLEDRIWTAVHGMLDGNKTGIVREVYQRVGDPPPPPAS